MEKPLSITSRDLELPVATEKAIRDRVARLVRFYPRLVGCSVLVEGPGRHHRVGGPYRLRVDLRVPDAEPLLVTRQVHGDLTAAVRETFDAARRQLEDFARRQRGDVKVHEEPAAV